MSAKASSWVRSSNLGSSAVLMQSRSGSGNRHRRVRQHTGTEKFKAGTTIHLPFDHFEAIDLAFHLTGAPRCVYGSGHSRDIFLQAVGEADDRSELAVFGSFNPTA